MGKNNNTIHINGKPYNAKTGALMAKDAPSLIKKPTMSDVVRVPANHAITHKTQSSQTLMRHVVKKPSDSLKRHAKVQSGKGAVARRATANVITKASVNRLDTVRAEHAKKTPKSKLVNRFIPSSNNAQGHHAAHTPTPQHFKQLVASHTPVSQPKTTADLLQHALEHATSHEQTYTPNKRLSLSSRIGAISTAAAVLALVVGVVASQSYNTVRLKVASSKAGISASAPNYQPAGYSLDRLTYSAGNVGLHFASNSDDRAFSISETASHWDSSTLRDLSVAPNGNNYQTIESAGRTIFLEGNNTASWVNAGILYQVKGQGVLNDQQLLKIANSL